MILVILNEGEAAEIVAKIIAATNSKSIIRKHCHNKYVVKGSAQKDILRLKKNSFKKRVVEFFSRKVAKETHEYWRCRDRERYDPRRGRKLDEIGWRVKEVLIRKI